MCLAGSPNHRSANKLAYTDVLLGILVFQDILMGMLVAFLPALAGHGSILKSAGLFAQVLLGVAHLTLFEYFSILFFNSVCIAFVFSFNLRNLQHILYFRQLDVVVLI